MRPAREDAFRRLQQFVYVEAIVVESHAVAVTGRDGGEAVLGGDFERPPSDSTGSKHCKAYVVQSVVVALMASAVPPTVSESLVGRAFFDRLGSNSLASVFGSSPASSMISRSSAAVCPAAVR